MQSVKLVAVGNRFVRIGCLQMKTGLSGVRCQSQSMLTVGLSAYYSKAVDHKDYFVTLLGAAHVLLDGADTAKYTHDWTSNYVSGNQTIVCLPSTTAEVSQLLSYCNQHKIGVVPQSGNTGLVGGSVGTGNNELILSLSRMNRIIDLDTQSGVLTCEAGCILEAVTHEVEKQGFLFPLDLGAKGSCMIGGNLSTNAGGLRVVKYGNLHGSVVGLEVVRADGTILDMTSTLRKDNCGYQLMHLFLGSEGTLGVITKANVLLAHKPSSSQVLLAKLSSFKGVSKLLLKARSQLGDNLTAFEFMDANSISTVRRETSALLHNLHPTVLPSVISQQVDDDDKDAGGIGGEVSVLIESTGTAEDLDRQRVDRFVELILEEGLVVDAVLSQSTAQERELWAVREHIPIALAKLAKMVHATTDGRGASRLRVGKLFKFDLSVNLKDTDTFIERVRDGLVAQGFRLKDDPSSAVTSKGGDERSSLLRVCELELCTFGHIADQNIHLNILAAVHVVERSRDGVDAFDGRHNDTRCFIMNTLSGDPIDADFAIRYNGSDCSIVVESLSDGIVRSYWMALQAIIDETVFALTNEFRGSISAEHGVGQQKKSALLVSKPPGVIRLMRDMKRLMDPNCILNPGKVIDL